MNSDRVTVNNVSCKTVNLFTMRANSYTEGICWNGQTSFTIIKLTVLLHKICKYLLTILAGGEIAEIGHLTQFVCGTSFHYYGKVEVPLTTAKPWNDPAKFYLIHRQTKYAMVLQNSP